MERSGTCPTVVVTTCARPFHNGSWSRLEVSCFSRVHAPADTDTSSSIRHRPQKRGHHTHSLLLSNAIKIITSRTSSGRSPNGNPLADEYTLGPIWNVTEDEVPWTAFVIPSAGPRHQPAVRREEGEGGLPTFVVASSMDGRRSGTRKAMFGCGGKSVARLDMLSSHMTSWIAAPAETSEAPRTEINHSKSVTPSLALSPPSPVFPLIQRCSLRPEESLTVREEVQPCPMSRTESGTTCGIYVSWPPAVRT